jgi:hypothetical protein
MDATILAAVIGGVAVIIAALVPYFRPKATRTRHTTTLPAPAPAPQATPQADDTIAAVSALATTADTYGAINLVIERVEQEEKSPRQLLLGALHGHSGYVPKLPDPITHHTAFDAAMRECILSPDWHVRVLYNITSEERLDQVVGWIENDEGRATKYEVKAFCTADAFPLLAPLVIGSRHAFLGIEEIELPLTNRVRASIHLFDSRAAALVKEYFDYLWAGPRDGGLFILRSSAGVDRRGVERLRGVIRRGRTPS